MPLPNASTLLAAFVNGILLGGLMVLAAIGLSMVFGVMRLVNLAHGDLVVLGAYAALVLARRIGLDPLLGALVIAPVLFLVGVPLQRWLLNPLMRKGAEAPLLTTFGLSIIAQNAFILAFSADTQSVPASYAAASVVLGGVHVSFVRLLGLCVAVAVAAGLYAGLTRTSLGREMRAAAEDAEAAEVLGIDVDRVYALTYGIGAACAASSGALLGMATSFTPSSGTGYTLTSFAVVALGGFGSLLGTLLGGLLLGVVESLSGAVLGDGYADLVGLLAFLVLLTARPSGLFGRIS